MTVSATVDEVTNLATNPEEAVHPTVRLGFHSSKIENTDHDALKLSNTCVFAVWAHTL